MRELNTPEGAQDRHGRLHRPETQSSVLICPACGGKGTYLGQIFHGVQPCQKCCGEGFDKTISQFSDAPVSPQYMAEVRELRGLLTDISTVLLARYASLFPNYAAEKALSECRKDRWEWERLAAGRR
jgi:hypothetical protein